MFARFDENPAMTLQDIKETKRYGRMDGCTHGRTHGHYTHHKVCGGYNKISLNDISLATGQNITSCARIQVSNLGPSCYYKHLIYKLFILKDKQEGPWALDRSPESLSGATKYKTHFPTLKSILDITQIITKAYQVTKFIQIILKHVIVSFIPFNLICNMTIF